MKPKIVLCYGSDGLMEDPEKDDFLGYIVIRSSGPQLSMTREEADPFKSIPDMINASAALTKTTSAENVVFEVEDVTEN